MDQLDRLAQGDIVKAQILNRSLRSVLVELRLLYHPFHGGYSDSQGDTRPDENESDSQLT